MEFHLIYGDFQWKLNVTTWLDIFIARNECINTHICSIFYKSKWIFKTVCICYTYAHTSVLSLSNWMEILHLSRKSNNNYTYKYTLGRRPFDKNNSVLDKMVFGSRHTYRFICKLICHLNRRAYRQIQANTHYTHSDIKCYNI